MRDAEVTLRAVEPSDRGGILDLLASGLSWVPDDRHVAFFEWKHRESPFGPSAGWVAEIDGELAGVRLMLRWELVDRDGTAYRAVRAVDSITHPAHQGRGVFSALATHAIERLTAEGIAFVFNTPNERSRPAWMKLGSLEVGHVRTGVRLRASRIHRLFSSRRPAEKWSIPTDAGLPAGDALADQGAVVALLETLGRPTGTSTRLSAEYLRWRYGFAPLAYRAELIGRSISDGVIIYRLRRRGLAAEAAVTEILVPAGGPSPRRALARVASKTGADHLLAVGPSASFGNGFLRVPALGPILVWHELARNAPPNHWALGLGDIELF